MPGDVRETEMKGRRRRMANSVNRQTVTSWFFCMVTASAIVYALDTLPAPAPRDPRIRTLARREDRAASRQDAERGVQAPSRAHVSRRSADENSLRTETSSPSRNKVFQTGRVLFHLIPYVRSKSSGASKRGRGRPRWPKDTTNLIDLVRFQGPLKVHRKTRASGPERALFHNVVYFETRKFDHLGAGFLGLSGIYCAMPAWG
jgi:hypothetical protein